MLRPRLRRCRERQDAVDRLGAGGRHLGEPHAPSVTVPVLSRSTTVERPMAASNTSPPLNRTPSSAARPVPAMIAAGVARPSAQGHAMRTTAVAWSTASGSRRRRRPTTRANVARRDREHDRHEDGRDPVGEPLDRRLRSLGGLEQPDDLGELRVLAPTFVTKTSSRPCPLIGRPDDLVAWARRRRARSPRSAGRGRPRSPLLHDAVGGIFSPGNTTASIAGPQLVDRDRRVPARHRPRSRFRRPALEQRPRRVAGARPAPAPRAPGPRGST